MRKHIQSYYSEDYHLVIIEKFLSSLHGDDLLTIVGSDEEVFKFYDSVNRVWVQQISIYVNAVLTQKTLESGVYLKYPEDQVHVVRGKQKLFGFRWNKDTDQLSYGLQANLIGVDIPTRRMLIQFFVSLFDPLGGVCPVTVEMKILFQDVCRARINWD